MESMTGLFKTESVKPRRPWKTLSEIEPATAEWIDRYYHRATTNPRSQSQPGVSIKPGTVQPIRYRQRLDSGPLCVKQRRTGSNGRMVRTKRPRPCWEKASREKGRVGMIGGSNIEGDERRAFCRWSECAL